MSDGEPTERTAISALRAGQVDGLIFTTASLDTTELPAALEAGLPIALVNRGLGNHVPGDQVLSDNLGGARAVADYFIRHGRIDAAMVAGSTRSITGSERRNGFVEGFRAAGIEMRPERLIDSDFDYASGRSSGLRLLESDPPQAVFCATDVTAIGVMDAAMQRGLRVPGDLWVVGYDDIPYASWDAHSLTSVRQPIPTLAEATLRTLITRIEQPDAPFERKRFPTELIIRGSTGYAPAHPADSST